ncbi:hypothetical protein ACYF6T_27480 [Streptomyces sp. 7R007]
MIIGLTEDVDDVEDDEDDEDDEFDELDVPVVVSLVFDAFEKSLSVASTPAIRSDSSVSEAELVAGLTVGCADAVAAPADDTVSAAATAAARPAAATGRPMRIRRL